MKYVPPPHSLQGFDDESFDGREFTFSSFTYRIAAIRNLGRVLGSRHLVLTDLSAIDRIDGKIETYPLHTEDMP